jgi:hypothetical protein
MEGGKFERYDEPEASSNAETFEGFDFDLHDEELRTEVARNEALVRATLKPGHPEVDPLLDPKRDPSDDSKNIAVAMGRSAFGSDFVKDLLADRGYQEQQEQANMQVFGDE